MSAHPISRLLLTGGSGLTGRRLVQQLLRRESLRELRVLVRVGHTDASADDRVRFVTADLTRADGLAELAQGCDAAIHLAVRSGGAKASQDKPWNQVTDNALIDTHLFHALAQAGVRRLVFASTASAYPELSGRIREEQMDFNRDPAPAHFGVGWVKRFSEKLCQFWHQSTGMEVMIARFANIYGPGARFDPDNSNFIAALVRKAVSGMDPFVVWGSPDVTRDVLYVDDAVAALIAMLDATDVRWGIYNIGSGATCTVGEVVDHALAAAGHVPSRIEYGSGAVSVAHRVLDCSKAFNELGWRAQIPLRQGITATTAWWQENQHTWTR